MAVAEVVVVAVVTVIVVVAAAVGVGLFSVTKGRMGTFVLRLSDLTTKAVL